MCVGKYEHVRWTQCSFSPPGDASGAEGGVAVQYSGVHQGDAKLTHSGAAPTSPPEGVFRHKRPTELDEQSGRTTGRLGL